MNDCHKVPSLSNTVSLPGPFLNPINWAPRAIPVIVSGVIFHLAAILSLCFPSYAKEPAVTSLPCEQYVSFVNPNDSYACEWFPFRSELQNWPSNYKKVICDAFCRIKRKAPGLVARACNGQKLNLVLNKDALEIEMGTYPTYIECSARLLEDGGVYECLLHELVHAVDTASCYSNASDWNCLVSPYIQSFDKKFGWSDEYVFQSFHQSVDPKIGSLGLPSYYAALNSAEALAEYSTAIVVADWKPPAGIKKYIIEKILSQPKGLDTERELLKQSDARSITGKFHECVVLATQVLKTNPASVPSQVYLADAWLEIGEPELVRYHVFKALQQLKSYGVPSYSAAETYCRDMGATACIELARRHRSYGENQLAIEKYSEAIRFDPENVVAYHERACVYSLCHELKKALSDCTKGINLDGAFAPTYKMRAALYEKLNLVALAKRDIRTFERLRRHKGN